MRITRIVSLILTLVLLMACVPMTAAYAYSMPYYIEVDLSNNIVTVYSTLDDTIVRQMICSSGTLKYESPKGTYYMPEKRKSTERGDWYTFEDGYGKYGSRIVGNYLFHSYLFLTKNNDDVDWETYQAMGTHASHGCIRLDIPDAKWIADNCMPGTRVKLFNTDKRYEYIKEIIYEETYTVDSGKTYAEFICMASNEDELGFNSEGEDVVRLQERLIEMGLYAGEADGYYGPAMVRTVKALQMMLGFPVTGVATKEFIEVINSDACPTSNICNLSIGSTGSTVVALQQTLAALGLYSGDAHGEYDEATAEAVRQFQRAMGYNPDGIATSALQQDMLDALTYLDEEFGDTGFMLTYEEEISVVGTINSSKKLNVRAKKSTDSTIIYRLEPGAKVSVLSIGDDGWAKIVYDSENTGYVRSSYLNVEEVAVLTPKYVAADATAPALPKLTYSNKHALSKKVAYGTVNITERLRLREAPDTDSEIVFMLSPGNIVEVISVNDGWAYVSYGGKYGYTYSKYFDIEYSAELTGSFAGTVNADTAESTNENSVLAMVISEEGSVIRSAASENGEIVTEAAYGDRMDVIFASTSWTQVNFNGTVGYISNEAIMTGTNDELDDYMFEIAEPVVLTGVVNTGSDAKLNMRDSASSDGTVLCELENGTELIINAEGEEWHMVCYGDTYGYVMSAYIDIIVPEEETETTGETTDETTAETTDEPAATEATEATAEPAATAETEAAPSATEEAAE